jgi:hypothetical protein
MFYAVSNEILECHSLVVTVFNMPSVVIVHLHADVFTPLHTHLADLLQPWA